MDRPLYTSLGEDAKGREIGALVEGTTVKIVVDGVKGPEVEV